MRIKTKCKHAEMDKGSSSKGSKDRGTDCSGGDRYRGCCIRGKLADGGIIGNRGGDRVTAHISSRYPGSIGGVVWTKLLDMLKCINKKGGARKTRLTGHIMKKFYMKRLNPFDSY